MSKYRGYPGAIRALVRSAQVHRDLYIDPEIFALEQEHLFANTWNYAGHDSQLPKAGDYITVDIAGQPLIVIRQKDSSIRVLKNRCAHKGARVVSSCCGNTGQLFRCPYHAWTFRTDGSLLSIPLKSGIEGTSFYETESAKGLPVVKNVMNYRGFIFVKLNDVGESFEDYFGESLSSIDNMVERSPEGALEVAGKPLRFINEANWKMYVENLNDTTHPMITHETSAGTAKAMWEEMPPGTPKPMPVQELVPFVSDYKFFEESGLRVFGNGHSVDGVNYSIHSDYSSIPGYEADMVAKYGAERAREILTMARHNTVYYPNLTIKGAIQTIRVCRPIAVNKTILESWAFRLKGTDDEMLHRTTMYNRFINGPFAMVGQEDAHNYRNIQKGLQATGNDWISLDRNYIPGEEARGRDQTVLGTSDLDCREQYRAWVKYMTMTM
ncbi:MAG: aromatic ring-hydroxylating dioxygenase subunit alpha [Comamonadaceae bacterium]|nr:aromatic ring-hydroxylating dioxygenase subunit alpha [Burkholderiales bacterium]MEB2348225.1 aromatic ring-hydroxylating dioxygenase subunit alpha [Comamonadaceae bacterium]